MEKEKKKLEIRRVIVPPGGESAGPFFTKVLKGGRVIDVQNQPKVKHIMEYTQALDYHGQHKMFYMSLMVPVKGGMMECTRICDYETHHGWDRGPGRLAQIRRMWYGNVSSNTQSDTRS